MKKGRIKELLRYFFRYYFPNYFSKIGGGFTLVGLILLILFFINIFIYRIFSLEEINNYLLTFAFGFASIGIAFVSLGVSKRSSVISKDSQTIAKGTDDKMTALVNSQFIEIYEEIQYITLKEIIPKIRLASPNINNSRSAYIWKYNHSLMRAIQLKEWADEYHKTNIVLPYKTLLEIIPWDGQMLKNVDINDILDGYFLIKKLDITNTIVEEIEELIEKSIVKRKKDEDLNDCIKRTQSELVKNSLERFKSPYH